MPIFMGYIGTYTKGDSVGIYSFKLDTEQKSIFDVKAVAECENPTYLTISQNNKYLYAVAKKGENGGVARYAINPSSGELSHLNSQFSPGASPCYVSLNRKNNFLFSANYHRGTVESYSLQPETGAPDKPISVIQHVGSGPDPRQEKAHAHYAGVTPDERYVIAVDLGMDAVITYQLHQDGSLEETNRFLIKPGSGPRHLAFHPQKNMAYIMTEFSSEVIVLNYHPDTGQFTEKQTISALPEFTEKNQGSAIQVSADGRFVYAGNRGHNSIAVFRVTEETGELSLVEHVSSEGDWPRDFTIDPTGGFLVGSNQESGNLVLYERNEETGKLSVLQSDIMVPYPVCVKFLHDS